MRHRATCPATLLSLAAGTMLSLSVWAATNTAWIDDPDNRGTEAVPINIYNAAKWTSGALPSSNYNLNFTAGGRTYITNSTTKQIATALRFLGGDFVVFGPMKFASFGYNASETAQISIDKRGNWTGDGNFWIATKDGSSFALTNTAGNLLSKNNPMRVGLGNNTTSAFVLQNGALTCSNNYCSIGFGNESIARFEQNGGTSTFGVRLQIAHGTNSTAVFTLNGGTAYVTDDLYVGNNGAGELTINNGEFMVGGDTWLGANGGSSSGNINLNGGTFATPYIRVPKNNGGGTILFNGGTLKAANMSDNQLIQGDSRIKIRIGAQGGTIDTAGFEIRYPKLTKTADGVTVDEGLTIRGGGVFTVAGDASNPRLEYNGKTTIELGTRVTIPTTRIGGGVVFTIPTGLAPAIYNPLTVSGNYTLERVLEDAVLPNDPNAQFMLSPDKKKIFCCYGMNVSAEGDPVWIGGGTGDLGDGANWSTGTVPQSGNCYFCVGEKATLTSSASFHPDSITFMENSKAVTINGTADITGITVVTNLSAVNHTINVPVRFVDKIRVQQGAQSHNSRTQPHVIFQGGAYGTTIDSDYSCFISGHYFLSDDTGAWTATESTGEKMFGLLEGSSISVPRLTNVSELFVGGTNKNENGGAVTTGVFQTSKRLCRFNEGTGEIVVTNELYVTLSENLHLAWRYSNGWFKFEKFTIGASSGDSRFYFANSGDFYYAKNVRIGAGGIGFESGLAKSPSIQFGRRSGDTITLAPWHSDFTVGTKGQTGKSDLTFASNTTAVFDTTDENGVGRTITLDALCGSVGPVNITGKGTVVVNNRANTCSGTVTVTNMATLALNAGCPLGTGAVTVSNATLKANSSGTVAFANKVVCQADAALAFHFTEMRTAPCLAFSSTMTGNAMPSALNIRVTAADELRPTGRRHTLTTGYDFTDTALTLVDPPDWIQSIGKDASGNIVLDVKSNGTLIIFQ